MLSLLLTLVKLFHTHFYFRFILINWAFYRVNNAITKETSNPSKYFLYSPKENSATTTRKMWPLSSISVVFLPCLAAFLLITALSSAYGYGYSEATCSGIVPLRYRNDKISITDFGGVGDGRTVNTKAFRAAIYRIQHLRRRGGTVLYIPPGVFLTESFSLTSHMTLFLARGAVIKAVQVQFFSM